mmetsp:Transcript_7173/g.8169  ORF Transcript_7173/g.8169 Transcript_7173/m.8169 type:complete len:161 (+) Transcript_7173:614-1096(+)
MLPSFFNEHPALKKQNSDGSSKLALVLGNRVWVCLSNNDNDGGFLDDHFEAVEFYINEIRKITNADIFWKSMKAMNPLVFNPQPKHPRVKYLSTSCTEKLYKGQAEVMERLGVPVIDVYTFTYKGAEWLLTFNDRHYAPPLDDWIMDYLYPVSDGRNHIF